MEEKIKQKNAGNLVINSYTIMIFNVLSDTESFFEICGI